jgi:hypothetical protein
MLDLWNGLFGLGAAVIGGVVTGFVHAQQKTEFRQRAYHGSFSRVRHVSKARRPSPRRRALSVLVAALHQIHGPYAKSRRF